MNHSWTATACPTIPTSLPWQYTQEGTRAIIVEEDGATVALLRTAENTTAHSGLENNVAYLVRAANLLPELTVIAQIVACGIYRAGHHGYVVCACCGERSESPHKAGCIVSSAAQLLDKLPEAGA